jgi:hypothetical protein
MLAEHHKHVHVQAQSSASRDTASEVKSCCRQMPSLARKETTHYAEARHGRHVDPRRRARPERMVRPSSRGVIGCSQRSASLGTRCIQSSRRKSVVSPSFAIQRAGSGDHMRHDQPRGDQRDMPHIPFPAKQWSWSSFPPDVGESLGHGFAGWA